MPSSQSNFDSEPLYRCMTKGVKGTAQEFAYGPAWVTARRASLLVYGDRLECGDWKIPYTSIEAVTLFETRQMFIPCYILRITTTGNSFRFGLNGNAFWRSELPFPVTREKGRLRYSAFSIVVRVVILVAVIVYLFYR